MKKSADSQRKSPRQGRSKALVEAIFEATVRILPRVGSRNITTKKIAEIAGVSIGSLYQYFVRVYGNHGRLRARFFFERKREDSRALHAGAGARENSDVAEAAWFELKSMLNAYFVERIQE